LGSLRNQRPFVSGGVHSKWRELLFGEASRAGLSSRGVWESTGKEKSPVIGFLGRVPNSLVHQQVQPSFRYSRDTDDLTVSYIRNIRINLLLRNAGDAGISLVRLVLPVKSNAVTFVVPRLLCLSGARRHSYG